MVSFIWMFAEKGQWLGLPCDWRAELQIAPDANDDKRVGSAWRSPTVAKSVPPPPQPWILPFRSRQRPALEGSAHMFIPFPLESVFMFITVDSGWYSS